MSSKTVALDLDPGNLVRLEAQALATDHRTVSDVVNEVLARARSSTTKGAEVKSVVGSARIAEEDPDLTGADAAIRQFSKESQERYPPG